MEIADYVNMLEKDGVLLADAAAQTGLESQVPTCPGWDVAELLAHIYFVHRWARAYVAEGITEMVPEPSEEEISASAPRGEELLSGMRNGHRALVAALRDAPVDLRCWTFLPAPDPLTMWARRQAHETAIHRVDAELAAGMVPAGFDRGFAIDGIEELLLGFLGRPRPLQKGGEVLGTIALVSTDGPESWSVRLTGTRADAEPGVAGWDLLIRASASDLYLLVWNRPTSADPDIEGDEALLDAWRERVQVTW